MKLLPPAITLAMLSSPLVINAQEMMDKSQKPTLTHQVTLKTKDGKQFQCFTTKEDADRMT